jgi:ABC-2 type transport system ATP-binding protein
MDTLKQQDISVNTEKEIIVEAVGLTKIFKDFWGRPKAKAVNDIDFSIFKGEIIGILGPNGSGKSTTIKMMLGLLYPSAGSVKVFSKSPKDVKIKKHVGYLPEESYLYKYLTALETLDFFGSLFNLSKPDRRRRSEQLLDMVGLTHAANRPIGEFSKGMARRIGIAQAMINDPELLILDEPTSGLDPLGCKEVKDLIKLLKSRGKTVIICSHLLSDVEYICDKVMIMYGGKIRAVGALDDLLTVSDVNTFSVPALSKVESSKVLNILQDTLKNKKVELAHPKKTLEEFFIEVVKQAEVEKIETAGAHGSGNIADYLTEDDEVTKNNLILEELTDIKTEKNDKDQDEKIEEQIVNKNVNKSLKDLLPQQEKEELNNIDIDGNEVDLNDKSIQQANEKLKDLLK